MTSINQSVCSFCVLFFFTASPVMAAVDAKLISELKLCALKADRTDRLACYDSISRNLGTSTAAGTAEPGTAAVAATAGSNATAVAESTAESTSTVAPENSTGSDLGVPVHSVACQLGPSDEYVFTLDNGEVWKQVSGKRLRLPDCEFSAIITKDFFGYKMIVEEESTKIRVKRVR